MKSKTDNFGDKIRTNTFKERPEDINRKGKEPGTLDYKTIAQMVVVGLGIGNDVRYAMIKAQIQMALIDKDWRALKELIDRFEGTITQKMEVNDTRPQIIVKDQEAADMINKMKDM